MQLLEPRSSKEGSLPFLSRRPYESSLLCTCVLGRFAYCRSLLTGEGRSTGFLPAGWRARPFCRTRPATRPVGSACRTDLLRSGIQMLSWLRPPSTPPISPRRILPWYFLGGALTRLFRFVHGQVHDVRPISYPAKKKRVLSLA